MLIDQILGLLCDSRWTRRRVSTLELLTGESRDKIVSYLDAYNYRYTSATFGGVEYIELSRDQRPEGELSTDYLEE